MRLRFLNKRLFRLLLIAAPLAIFCILFFPAIASAHAILLRSDPPKDAVLTTAPGAVRMWFTEDLNPAFSTAQVINAASKRVDNNDAHVNPGDATEMDLTLKHNLPPAVYIVVYRTDSAVDGHVLSGSFIFTVSNPDGTVPTLSPGANPGANVFGGGNLTGLYTGHLDPPTLFNLIVITLVELGAVFWVGSQLWINFVLQMSSEKHPTEQTTNEQAQARFEKRFSFPTLLVILLANVGVLYGQAINLTGGNWGQALSLSLLSGLATSGRFGTFWLMREGVIALAMFISLYMLMRQQRPRWVNALLPLVNLLLGLMLFIAITMSSHAGAVSSNRVTFAIIDDWLHQLAAALWVGGMLYITTNYLPILKKLPLADAARSLVTVLPYFSPLAFAGVIIMSISGPFSATFHLNSWSQFINTAYGRALVVKIGLVGGLLITSAVHVFLLRPRLKKEYRKYSYAASRLATVNKVTVEVEAGQTVPVGQNATSNTGTEQADKQLSQQVRLREKRLNRKTRRLISILRWEPMLGVAVLVCVGLMNVFAGTLSPIAAAAQQQPGAKPQPFIGALRTKDGKFTAKLEINPNLFGTNVFTVSVIDNSTGKPDTNIGVTIYTTMLDMDMGTGSINLLPDGKGHFSASGDLSMAGHWQIRLQIRTPDNTLHEVSTDITTPF
ncbi:MAG TPA: copper resistance protein CopC [Ktedonobacteraceae bacterium]|nr:copper resistance protein CopC [Ktedonobacteraceae bacterium]